jgi:hypothetical protein
MKLVKDSDGEFITGARLSLAGVLLAFGVVSALGFAAHAISIADDATLGKKEANVRTEIFEESVAHREGTRRDFEELYRSYLQAKTNDERSVLVSLMQHRADGCAPELVPPSVQALLHPKGTR